MHSGCTAAASYDGVTLVITCLRHRFPQQVDRRLGAGHSAISGRRRHRAAGRPKCTERRVVLGHPERVRAAPNAERRRPSDDVGGHLDGPYIERLARGRRAGVHARVGTLDPHAVQPASAAAQGGRAVGGRVERVRGRRAPAQQRVGGLQATVSLLLRTPEKQHRGVILPLTMKYVAYDQNLTA